MADSSVPSVPPAEESGEQSEERTNRLRPTSGASYFSESLGPSSRNHSLEELKGAFEGYGTILFLQQTLIILTCWKELLQIKCGDHLR